MKKLTAIFTICIILIIAIFDVYVIVNGGTEASISHLIITWSYKYPIFTFMFGVVCGHLFWRVRQTRELDELSLRVDNINKRG